MDRRESRGRRDGARPRVLLAPSGFKEGLDVHDVLDCMARGVAAVAPRARILRARP